MQIGIIPDHNGNESFSDVWIKYFKQKKVKTKIIDLNTPLREQISMCDGIMWRFIHTHRDKVKAYRIIQTIDLYYKIPIFPNFYTCWHYDEKITQSYIMEANNIPTPKTWIFWKKEKAIEFIYKANYPLIFKLSAGASSSNVFKIETVDEAKKVVDKMFDEGVFTVQDFNSQKNNYMYLLEPSSLFYRSLKGVKAFLAGPKRSIPSSFWSLQKGYVYFQEFLAENSYDTRVIFVNNKVFALRRFNQENDFRASGSDNVDLNPKNIDLRFIKMAFDISKKMKFQCMSYDFMYKNKKPVLGEMSYTSPLNKSFPHIPGYWNKDMKWVKGKANIAIEQVESFINSINT